MANIKDKIAQIRQAIFGKEVRESIASGIEAINKEVENTTARQDNVEAQFQAVLDETTGKDVISAPEITAARVGADNTTHSNLKARLDAEHNEVMSQLAQTEQELSQELSVVVSELKRKRDKTVLIGLDDLDEEALSAIAGEGVELTIKGVPKNYSVTPIKTTFVETNNLFDGEYKHGVILAGASEQDMKYSTKYSADGVSIVMQLPKNKTYTISKSDDTNRFGIATFTKLPEAGDSVNRLINHPIATENNPITFTLEGDESYIVVYVDNEGREPEWLQVEEGSEATQPNAIKLLNLKKESIPKDAIDFKTKKIEVEDTSFIRKVNLFNGVYSKGVNLRGDRDVGITYNTGYELGVSVEMYLEKLGTYTVSKSDDTDRFGIALFVGKPEHGDTPNRVINYPANTQNNPITFTLEGDENYIVVYVDSNGREPEWFQIEKGTVATKPNAVIIDNLVIPELEVTEVTDEYLIQDFAGYYKNKTSFIDLSVADSAATVYAEYDRLVNENPDYISRELLGRESTGLPIYLYKFRARLPQGQGLNYRNPRILFLSGIHGNEHRGVLEGLRFFDDLATNWRDSDELMMLRWNVDFDVIPVLNPYGLNHKQRRNANGVDLNRNFILNWQPNPDPDDPYYGGTEPLSEIESQLLDNYLQNNRDLIFAIDYHKYNTLASDGHATWMGGINQPNILEVLTSLAKYTNAALKRDFPFVDQTNNNLTLISSNLRPGVARGQFIYRGIPGAILETVWSIGGDSDPESDFYIEKASQQFAVDLIGNLILTAVRNRRKLKLIQ